MSSEDETAVPAATGLNMTGLHFRPSTIWPINLTVLFVMVEDWFILRSIVDEMLSYHPVLPCRLESAIIPMSDFVKGQLPVGPYK
jgi:hypothetical protein